MAKPPVCKAFPVPGGISRDYSFARAEKKGRPGGTPLFSNATALELRH